MLRFHELAPSPNNVKVRMALRFKRIDFATVPLDPADRSPLVELSGQEFTPAIEDRGIVLNDSEAILQYLDANYPGTPRLFPALRAGRKVCEAWHKTLDRKIARHWAPVFFFATQRREELDLDARQRFHEGLSWLDDEIGERSSIEDDPQMAVCDLRVAEWACYALPSDGLIRRVPLFRRFAEHYGVERGKFVNLERLIEPWLERLA
jgi:glutathione S-transferase